MPSVRPATPPRPRLPGPTRASTGATRSGSRRWSRGADGAIYAIRKALYEPLRDEDINDFVNPLQIIAKGYRGVYEAEAVALEETAGSYAKEFRRKARIVNRSFSGLMRVKQVLSPLRVGAFAFEIWTHKLLRWLAPAFMAVGVTGAFVLSLRGSRAFTVVSLLFVLFYLAFYLGYAFRSKLSGSPILLVPYYFMMVNAAAVVGVWHSLRGRVQVTWAPPRSGSGGAARGWTGVVLVHALLVLLSLYAVSRVRSL
jgi:hypothetical protein